MSPFPSAERDLAELERFIEAELPPERADDPVVVDLRRKAERLALRMGNPVRVAIAGLPGAGKTTLANFLAGQIYESPKTEDGIALPVILRFGEKPETIAGWWSGIEIPQKGIEPQAAAVHGPDYIELRLPNSVLEYISFLDMPGVEDWPAQKQQIRWVGSRADAVLWCTRADNPWIDEEWQLWSLTPRRVQARSLLVATHADRLKGPEALQPVLDRLTPTTKDQFADLIAIGTKSALLAAPNGRVLSAAAWEASGGRAMVGALLATARAVRRADIAASRELLASAAEALGLTREQPAMPSAARAESGAADAAVGAGSAAGSAAASGAAGADRPQSASESPPSEAAAEAPAPASMQSPLLGLIAERAEALIAYVEGDDFKDWEFMAQLTDLADQISATTVSSMALKQDAAWIKHQLEDALVALSLLQMEQGERPCEDAAMVLLQLARDLAWAAAPAEAA